MAESEAAGKENVVMRAGVCAVTIMPYLGGKIASITVRGNELLQARLAPYAPRTRTMSFDAGDASGWDECLPSVAACAVETEAGTAIIPDHGDLWRVEWNALLSDQLSVVSSPPQAPEAGASVQLRGECFSLPLSLERTVTLREASAGWELTLEYTVTNMGSFPSPWSWAAHPLFAAEAGDRIVLPASIDTLRLEGSGGNRLGNGGDTISWPMAALADGGVTDLSVAGAADSGIGDKLFAGPLSAAEKWCALERPGAGLRIKVGFDPAATPYLGLWICYGGWPERDGSKQACVALEPATAPVDSLAATGPWSRMLSPGESYEWRMTVEITGLENVNRHA
jgi:galactose mutarotase-like enzyme